MINQAALLHGSVPHCRNRLVPVVRIIRACMVKNAKQHIVISIPLTTRPSALGMSDPIKDLMTVEPFEWRTNTNTRLKVNIPEIWSIYQKYCQSTRNMVNRPEIWPTDQKYGQQTKNMVNIPEIWSTYQKYGQQTRTMVNIPELWSTYQKNGQHIACLP